MKDEFDLAIRRALEQRVAGVHASEGLLQGVKQAARWRGRRRGRRRFVLLAAIVCLLGASCYAAVQLTAVEQHTVREFADYAQLDAARAETGIDAKCVEAFEGGFAFESASVDSSQAKDGDGQPMGRAHPSLSISYRNGQGQRVMLSVEASNPYIEAGEATPEGYSSAAFKFVPVDYERSPEDLEKEATGELFVSYGAEVVELRQAEFYCWRDEGLLYSLTAFDCNLGADAMARMAQEVVG